VIREVRYGAAALRRRPLLRIIAWSVPEAVPAALSGLIIAKAIDTGFLAGRPSVGLAWLLGLLAAAGLGAVGGRQVYLRLGDLVEPFRDTLVRRVVAGALDDAVSGQPDDGALSRLTRQIEIVRDTYAGLLVVIRGFAVTVTGVVLGLLAVDPAVALLVLPPFVLAVVVFLATLGVAAARQRASVRADERLASAAGTVFAGLRDIVASGTEAYAATLLSGPIRAQAAAERALGRVAALRTMCFAIGGWLPIALLLLAGGWLVDRGLTAGTIIGGLTYVLIGLQPALHTLMTGVGGSGLRYVVTLGRILDASPLASGSPASGAMLRSTVHRGLSVRGLTFAYGPHAEPVLRDLDLDVPDGDHLTIVGPSGIGKSTLAGLLCGLLPPGAGTVTLGGVPLNALTPAELAASRVLIPQEAYVFTGSVRDNLIYLRPDASAAELRRAVSAVGAGGLIEKLGGLDAQLRPAELSSGERQLLALVRAYLSPAPLVVLDEATCYLDGAAERRAEEAFAARDGTLVVIAHRMSSALRAARVLVLDGTSAIVGDHDTVRANSPLYRELLGFWDAGGGEEKGGGPRRVSVVRDRDFFPA